MFIAGFFVHSDPGSFQDELGQPAPDLVLWRCIGTRVEHVPLWDHAQQTLQRQHGRKVVGVVQHQHDDTVGETVGDAALCLVNRETTQVFVIGEVGGDQQQDLWRAVIYLFILLVA